jgi:hypothetical protein
MAEKGDETTEQSEFEYYLPGMPSLSAAPGRVERFVTTLFRRRGPVYVRVRRQSR